MKAIILKIDRKYWIIAGVVLLALIALVAWNVSSNRTVRAAQNQRYRVTRGTLTQSVGGTGSVHASQSAVLTWQTTGKVGAVNAQIGDKVSADQVLAALEQTSLPQAVIQAQVDLYTAQSELAQATISNTGRATAEQAVAAAQQALQDAQQALDATGYARASDELIQNTDAQITLAKQSVARASDRYRGLEHLSDDNQTKAQALVALTNAQINLNTLIANYNWYTGQATSLELVQAQAARDVAKAQLEDAQRTLSTYSDGSVPADLAAAQAKVAIAQSTLNQAKISAPFAGVVTEADANVGDLVSSGTNAFRVDNLAHLLVDVGVSEVDINEITPGLPVTMTFDAIPGKTYNGKVAKVNLAGETTSNAVTFTISTELTDGDAQVKPGMSATVTVIVKHVEDALLVPNRAIRTVNGKRVVDLVRNGQVSQVEVQIGATSDTVSEILSGLQEGDELAFTGATGTAAAPGGFGGGGIRFRGP